MAAVHEVQASRISCVSSRATPRTLGRPSMAAEEADPGSALSGRENSAPATRRLLDACILEREGPKPRRRRWWLRAKCAGLVPGTANAAVDFRVWERHRERPDVGHRPKATSSWRRWLGRVA
jgi:hypothetical protein